MKILYQGSPGAYSHLAAKELYPDAEIISCKTFDECFVKAEEDKNSRIIIPESNRITGNIGIEYLIFKFRLNIYAEHFYKISHNLLGLKGTKIENIKNVYSHAQALSQSSEYIKRNKLIEHVRADTAGSAKFVSESKDNTKGAIASSLSAEIYDLKIIDSDIQDNTENFTRFLLMGKDIIQPENDKNLYITSFLFKLKSKPAALYSALQGMAINGVNMIKLQSFPEKNSFSSYFFLCEVEGHIENQKIKNSLEDLNYHCEDMSVLGVFEADKLRKK